VRATNARGHCTLVALLVIALLLAACSKSEVINGGGNDPTTSGVTRGATSSVVPTTPSEPVLAMERFETPSHNILCQSFVNSFACVIDSGLVPEPSHDFCPVDWIGLFIQVGAYSGPSCAGDAGVDRTPATILPYGRRWARAGVRCRSEQTGLTCRDGDGNGFTLARAHWELLGKEAAATAAFGELRKLVRSEARDHFGSGLDSVHSPTLRAGDDCDGLQQAFVDLIVNPEGPVIYEACFVSGTWQITDGPLFPD
jgi:hypothetical protein